MSIHFFTLQVKEITRETSDCVSIAFTVPEDLKDKFRFQAGQYLNLRAVIDGSEVRRSYSICKAPFEQELRVAVKKTPGGVFSTYANEGLKQGDVLEVMPPQGKFTCGTATQQQKHYVAIAAGSGITPVISIIKQVLHDEPLSSFTLVYGNRNRHSVIFFEELEALKNKYMNRFSLIHVFSREKTDTGISFGRIDREKLEALDRLIDYSTAGELFICGPEELILTAKDYFEQRGFNRQQIHFELFTTGASKKPTATTAQSQPGGPASHITIQLDGRTFSFDIPMSSDTTILDAAAAQGADVPYACKGGVCCTCKAKLLEGEVSMDVHWGLDHEEIEQGYILTCQAHPKTETVVVDFDVK
jgi:ring-1,2-phenylacetyl-CoA epoxidase subunit PaaE